jgi:hypothetical protein
MDLDETFYGTFEVSNLEYALLTLTQFGAPCLAYFALLTFAAVTLIQSFVNLNHTRTVAAYNGNGVVIADEVRSLWSCKLTMSVGVQQITSSPEKCVLVGA